MRSIPARSGFCKAPNVGAYPPVKRGCSPQRSLYSRCRLCSSPYGVSCCLWWVWVAVAGVAVSCSWRCSCTGWRGFRCPTKTMARPFRSSVVDQTLCSTIPVEDWIELVSWTWVEFFNMVASIFNMGNTVGLMLKYIFGGERGEIFFPFETFLWGYRRKIYCNSWIILNIFLIYNDFHSMYSNFTNDHLTETLFVSKKWSNLIQFKRYIIWCNNDIVIKYEWKDFNIF